MAEAPEFDFKTICVMDESARLRGQLSSGPQIISLAGVSGK